MDFGLLGVEFDCFLLVLVECNKLTNAGEFPEVISLVLKMCFWLVFWGIFVLLEIQFGCFLFVLLNLKVGFYGSLFVLHCDAFLAFLNFDFVTRGVDFLNRNCWFL